LNSRATTQASSARNASPEHPSDMSCSVAHVLHHAWPSQRKEAVSSCLRGVRRTTHRPVLISGGELVKDFEDAMRQLDLPGWPCALTHELLPAPHKQPHLRPGHGAVYAFVLSAASTSLAGAGMVLKVGRAGPNSDQRFYSHHYNFSAGSTLAKSLVGHPVVWPWLGIAHLDSATVKQWMLTNLDRLHIYVPAKSSDVLPVLEMYVRARIGSVFEGAA
jgi:hypothetical protein